MQDVDERLVAEMDGALSALEARYWQSDSEAEKALLQPQIELALQNWVRARIRLLHEGTIANEADIQAVAQIKSDIEAAAETQALVVVAVRLVAAVAKFMI